MITLWNDWSMMPVQKTIIEIHRVSIQLAVDFKLKKSHSSGIIVPLKYSSVQPTHATLSCRWKPWWQVREQWADRNKPTLKNYNKTPLWLRVWALGLWNRRFTVHWSDEIFKNQLGFNLPLSMPFESVKSYSRSKRL